MNAKAVIFDLDGVLVHTDRFHYQAWKETTADYGLWFDEKMNDLLRGVSREESLAIILEQNKKQLTDHEKKELIIRKNEVYQNLIRSMSESDVSEEVLFTLKKLRKMNYRLAVGSSSKNARVILENTKLLSLFDEISDGNNITHSKPDPEVFEKAAQFLNVEKSLCIVVEDAVSGVEAGRRANMKTFAVGDASKKGCGDYNVDELNDIIYLLKYMK